MNLRVAYLPRACRWLVPAAPAGDDNGVSLFDSDRSGAV